MEERLNKKGANIQDLFLKLGYRYIVRTKLIIYWEYKKEGLGSNGIHYKPNNKRGIKSLKQTCNLKDIVLYS